MARRIGGLRLFIPGIADALADYWRTFDARFSGQGFGGYAATVEAGEPIIVGYESLFCAMFRAGLDRNLGQLAPGARYRVIGDTLANVGEASSSRT